MAFFVLAVTFYLFVVGSESAQPTVEYHASSTQSAAAASGLATTTSLQASTTTKQTVTPKTSLKPVIKPQRPDTAAATTSQASRVEAPYSTPPEDFENVSVATRGALVNILCMPQGGTLRPISGSGVIIDPRGVILTNAHVAQYVLLSQSSKVDLNCEIRSGSPAAPMWKAEVLYIPSVWVNKYASDINQGHVAGTGEHDYALLRIISTISGAPVSETLPYLPIETRENVAFQGDPVLVSGYPAEFVGGINAQYGLYPALSVSTIKQLLTFETGSIDVFSLGGIIVAQGGSSGGPIVNSWHRVVGIVTTTSEGATTADRDLHATTLAYIDHDFRVQSGRSLYELFQENIAEEAHAFMVNSGNDLTVKYLKLLSH